MIQDDKTNIISKFLKFDDESNDSSTGYNAITEDNTDILTRLVRSGVLKVDRDIKFGGESDPDVFDIYEYDEEQNILFLDDDDRGKGVNIGFSRVFNITTIINPDKIMSYPGLRIQCAHVHIEQGKTENIEYVLNNVLVNYGDGRKSTSTNPHIHPMNCRIHIDNELPVFNNSELQIREATICLNYRRNMSLVLKNWGIGNKGVFRDVDMIVHIRPSGNVVKDISVLCNQHNYITPSEYADKHTKEECENVDKNYRYRDVLMPLKNIDIIVDGCSIGDLRIYVRYDNDYTGTRYARYGWRSHTSDEFLLHMINEKDKEVIRYRGYDYTFADIVIKDSTVSCLNVDDIDIRSLRGTENIKHRILGSAVKKPTQIKQNIKKHNMVLDDSKEIFVSLSPDTPVKVRDHEFFPKY